MKSSSITTKQRSLSFIFIIVALSSGAFVATDLYLPSFPSLVQHYHVQPGSVQLTLSLFVFAFACSQFLGGIASDRFGRKPVLLVGISVFILGSACLFLTSSILWLYVARLLQGLGIGAVASISRILVRDVYQGKKLASVFSLVAGVILITPAVAPYFGGILQEHFGFYGSYFVMLIYGFMLFALIKYLLSETNRSLVPEATQPRHVARKLVEMLSVPKFTGLVLSNGAAFAMVLVYSTISPFIMETHFGFTPSQYGGLLLFIASGLVLGTSLSRFALKYLSSERIVMIGLSFAMLVNLSMFSAYIFHLLTPMILASMLFLSNIGVGLILPNNAAMIFNIFSSPSGMVGAVYGSLRMLVAAIIGMIIAVFHFVTIEQMVILLLVINLMAIISYQFARYSGSLGVKS